MFDFLKPHLKPLQAPHPPIGVAGLSKGSDTLKLAGERGYIPMSLNLNPAYVGSHWESVEIGAAKTGRKPNRSDWRMVREVFVADTDEEAWRLSVGDMMGRMMGEYFLPLLGHFGFKDYLKPRPTCPTVDVTAEYCAQAQLDRRLARDRHREDREDLRRGRRLRHAAGVRLRLQAQAGGLAQLAAAAEAGSDAAAEASRRGPDQGGVIHVRHSGAMRQQRTWCDALREQSRDSGFDASHRPGMTRSICHPLNSASPPARPAAPARTAAGGGRFRASVCRIAPCAFASSWRPMRAGGEAAVEHGGDRFPVQSGDAAGDQHAVVAQALHHRADHLDARAGQFGEGCDRLRVFSLFGKAKQLRLVELAVFGERRDEAAGARRNRGCATFRGWRRRRPRRSRRGFPRT